ncbi:glycosyltransferase family 25 protein [Vibrio sp. FNV 38]|nr:glycosyltransferase family 25 protein [Vibrio sp. FNV 38]
MKAYCITLKGCEDRQQHVQDVLSHASVEMEFFLGVDARVDAHPLLERYNEQKFANNMGRIAAKGELGCYASHYLMWQKCVADNEPIIVFEDDFNIDIETFNRSLDIARHHIDECGYIRLENTGRKILSYITHSYEDQHLVKFLKIPQCMTGYAISPKTAKAFIEKSDSFDYPVDVFLRNAWIHKESIFGIWNTGLWGGNKPSVIGDRKRKGKKNYYIATMKILNKVKNMTLNLLTNFYHLWKLGLTYKPLRIWKG